MGIRNGIRTMGGPGWIPHAAVIVTMTTTRRTASHQHPTSVARQMLMPKSRFLSGYSITPDNLWSVLMFIRLHPGTLVRDGLTIPPVGENFYFNVNRIGFARFRSSTERDQGGLGADSSKIPEGTPCLEISIEGSPTARSRDILYFPGALESEYRRLLQIIEHRLL
jgi:hypothetical protein